MNLLDNITTLVHDQVPTWIVGTNMFVDALPTQGNTAVIGFYEYQGSDPVIHTHSSVRSVQCRARALNPEEALQAAWSAYKALYTEDFHTVLGDKPCLLSMRGTPLRVEVDELDRTHYTFNMGVTYEFN